MWITKQEYRDLIERAAAADGQVRASDARVEALVVQLNTIARDNAEMKTQLTGKPATLPVFAFQREASPRRPSEIETGVSFDDMGDEAAHVAGFTES